MFYHAIRTVVIIHNESKKNIAFIDLDTFSPLLNITGLACVKKYTEGGLSH